jgi:hypothetical protein
LQILGSWGSTPEKLNLISDPDISGKNSVLPPVSGYLIVVVSRVKAEKTL